MFKLIKKNIRKIMPKRLLRCYDYFRYPIRRELKMCLAGKYVYRGQEGAEKVRELLCRKQPCLIARFGWNEIYIVMEYLRKCHRASFAFNPDYCRMMHEVAGFFPPSTEALARFASESLEIVKNIDILGVVGNRGDELLIRNYNPDLIPVEIQCIGDHIAFQESPWTLCLRDKKVLVIHPFAETIRKQYAKRLLLFNGREVLPEFELLTLRTVLSNGDASASLPYSDWFAALNSMCQQIDKIDFEVALIGAGAYGMFLGDFCKRIGKQAVHLGGATQLLFGIKGLRWEHHYPPEFSVRLFNQHWVRPAEEETPPGVGKVEDGCYW
jgi:hypothetical protein